MRCYRCSPSQNIHSCAGGEIECKVCGKRVAVPHLSAKHCSDECTRIANAAFAKQAHLRRIAHKDRSPRKCAYLLCASVFTPGGTFGVARTKFCTVSCATRERYRLLSGNCHKRRAKRYGCEYVKFDKEVVFERDGWRCMECGIPTPRSLMGKRKLDSPELDHYIPMSARGAHTLANTRCLCLSCNRIKSDTIPCETLLLRNSRRLSHTN